MNLNINTSNLFDTFIKGIDIIIEMGWININLTGLFYIFLPNILLVSDADQMWGVSQEGQLYKRYTKNLNKECSSELDRLLARKTSVSMSSDDGWELL